MITVSECCSIKLVPYISFEKFINILALEMASPWNHYCASCIGTFVLYCCVFHLVDNHCCSVVANPQQIEVMEFGHKGPRKSYRYRLCRR